MGDNVGNGVPPSEKTDGAGRDSEANGVGKKEKTGPKRGMRKIAVLIIGIAIIIAALCVIYYFIRLKSGYGETHVVFTRNEIESADEIDSITDVEVGSKIYFFVYRTRELLDAEKVELIIEIKRDGTYRPAGKISYDVSRDFQRLRSYIPEEYFRVAGTYRITTLLDEERIANHIIMVK